MGQAVWQGASLGSVASEPPHQSIRGVWRWGAIAANLTAMLPKVKVIDATAVDVTDDEKDTTSGPSITQEE